MQYELTYELIQNLKGAIQSADYSFVKNLVDNLHAADISDIIHRLEPEDAIVILNIISIEDGADVLMHLDDDYRKRFLKEFKTEQLAEYLNLIDSDDAVDIINELPVKRRDEVLLKISNHKKTAYILDLLHYEEDCAGGLMAKELVKVKLTWTVNECIEEIRRQSKYVEKIYSVYVVDDYDRLVGIVHLKKLLLSDGNILVAEIYDEDIIRVETYRDAEEVARIMQKYDLESIPVVNVQGKLAGRITIDDVIDVITEMAELERQMMAGISESTEEDSSIWVLSKSRLPWLLVGMTGGMLGAWFMGFFEGNIKLIPAMAFFIPLITATGGNVGIQSSSIVVQSLANRESLDSFNASKLIKGFFVALVNGLAISSIVFLFNMFVGRDIKLGLVVSVALLCVVVIASFFGTITPLILNKIKINPALASGPFITTINDLLGLAIYFIVASILLNF
jgi:magnesium transporter